MRACVHAPVPVVRVDERVECAHERVQDRDAVRRRGPRVHLGVGQSVPVAICFQAKSITLQVCTEMCPRPTAATTHPLEADRGGEDDGAVSDVVSDHVLGRRWMMMMMDGWVGVFGERLVGAVRLVTISAIRVTYAHFFRFLCVRRRAELDLNQMAFLFRFVFFESENTSCPLAQGEFLSRRQEGREVCVCVCV